MRTRITTLLMALALCLTGARAENPFAKLSKIKGVEYLYYETFPDSGIQISDKGVNLNIGNAYDLAKSLDPRDIAVIYATKKKTAAQLFLQADDICQQMSYEPLINLNDGNDKVRLYVLFGEVRSKVALVLADKEDGAVVSADIKANREELMQLLQQMNGE